MADLDALARLSVDADSCGAGDLRAEIEEVVVFVEPLGCLREHPAHGQRGRGLLDEDVVLPAQEGGGPLGIVEPGLAPAGGYLAQIDVFGELGFVAEGAIRGEGIAREASPRRVGDETARAAAFVGHVELEHESGAVIAAVPHPVHEALVVDVAREAVRARLKEGRHVEFVVGMREGIARLGALHHRGGVQGEFVVVVARDVERRRGRARGNFDLLSEEGVYILGPVGLGSGDVGFVVVVDDLDALERGIADPFGVLEHLRAGHGRGYKGEA